MQPRGTFWVGIKVIKSDIFGIFFLLLLHKIIIMLLARLLVSARQLSLVRKLVFRVSDLVRHKPGCTATEDG